MDNPNTVAESIDAKPKSTTRYLPEIIVGAGYLLFAAAMVVACVASLLLVYRPSGSRQSMAAAPSQLVTPTPHILSTPAADAPAIFTDDFNDNSNGWKTRNIARSRSEVKDGALVLESIQDGKYGLVTCVPCLQMNQPYYVQAEFATDKSTHVPFGILLALDASKDYFYLFEINTETRKCTLDYHVPDLWFLRSGELCDAIRSFPATNVLGLYIGSRRVEFYINGIFVDSYEDSTASFDNGGIGFYVNNSGPMLQIDNLIVQEAGGQ